MLKVTNNKCKHGPILALSASTFTFGKLQKMNISSSPAKMQSCASIPARVQYCEHKDSKIWGILPGLLPPYACKCKMTIEGVRPLTPSSLGFLEVLQPGGGGGG